MELSQPEENSHRSEPGCIRITIETPNMRGSPAPSNGNGTKVHQVLVESGAQTPAQVQEDQQAASESTLTKREQRAKEKRENKIKWRKQEIERCTREACRKELSDKLRAHDMTAAKTRQDIQREECTMNPIFLFQKGIVRIGVDAPVEHDGGLDKMICTTTGNPITDNEILGEGYGWIEWLTEHVWETREEAEEWGRTHAYRYRGCDGKDGRPGNEWRVFCVPCAGELARRLNDTEV